MFNRTLTLTAVALLFLFGSCSESINDRPLGNQLPKTFLWLYPDSTVGVGVSRQHLRWWGEDPDGVIRGYLFAFGIFDQPVTSLPTPDTLRYSWVSTNDTLILFPLDTLFRRFTVFVRAVDNSFAGLPPRSIVRMHPTPFVDNNNNGVFDSGDRAIPEILEGIDPRGAVQTFPIRNTPPTLSFARDPNDNTKGLKQPDTTFTVATFSWKATDADGDNTLSSYRIALNDTSDPSRWLTIPIRDTIVTLVVPRSRSDAGGAEVAADVYGGKFLGRQFLGTIQGLRLDALNRLFVQVKDVAGEFSQPIAMPGGTQHWFVRRPQGKILIVSDYVTSDSTVALTSYRDALAAVPGGQFATVDQTNIARGLSAADKRLGRVGSFVHPFIDPAMIQTFLLYDYVFWYTDQFPSLGIAQLTLFTYMQNGGKVIFSTTFENSVDPRGALRDFAPIDSISSVDLSPTRPPVPPPVAGDTRLPGSFVVLPDSNNPNAPYPQLALNGTLTTTHSIFMRPIYRRSDARYVYRLQPDTRIPMRYFGAPNVAVVDGEQRILFMGLPIHLLNNSTTGNPGGISAFFSRVLLQELSLTHRVDRSIF